MDVVAARTRMPPKYRQPILYLSHDDFANLGERWIYAKG
jgi:hypothetical protein